MHVWRTLVGILRDGISDDGFAFGLWAYGWLCSMTMNEVFDGCTTVIGQMDFVYHRIGLDDCQLPNLHDDTLLPSARR